MRVRTTGAEFAESDFIITDPARGVLGLEVKGGLLDKKDGAWRQNGQAMRSLPLDQAHRFIMLLLAKFREKDRISPPIGVAAAFPDTDFEIPASQGDLVADVAPGTGRYAVRMNITVSRACGALRIVISRSELDKDPILKRLAEDGRR